MGKRDLAAAINEVPPPPCEKFFCQMRQRCAEEELACWSFALYIDSHSGRSVSPKLIEVGRELRVADAPTPTREMFDRIFREDDPPSGKRGLGVSTICRRVAC